MFLLTEASEDALNAGEQHYLLVLTVYGSDRLRHWYSLCRQVLQCARAGFTRAKNAGNIIMKNLMDFCLGTVAFILVGYNLLCGVGNNFVGWGLKCI